MEHRLLPKLRLPIPTVDRRVLAKWLHPGMAHDVVGACHDVFVDTGDVDTGDGGDRIDTGASDPGGPNPGGSGFATPHSSLARPGPRTLCATVRRIFAALLPPLSPKRSPVTDFPDQPFPPTPRFIALIVNSAGQRDTAWSSPVRQPDSVGRVHAPLEPYLWKKSMSSIPMC